MIAARKIRPCFVLSWALATAKRLLPGHVVLVSYALLIPEPDKAGGKPKPPRITIDDVAALAALGCELVFDSGKFSAWSRGLTIDNAAYYAFLRELDARGVPWTWAVACDEIGDAAATRAEWRHALATYPDLAPRLVPVFHEGDPWSLLAEYGPDSRLVALGRIEGRKSKQKTLEWYDAVFNRYPNGEFHALGNGTPDTIECFPFRWFDVSTWDRNAGYSNALGFPFNRCSREVRQLAYIEAFETFEHRPAKQLSLLSLAEREAP